MRYGIFQTLNVPKTSHELQVEAYTKRLRIPMDGDPSLGLYTSSGVQVATGYERIVVGDRGPYVELEMEKLHAERLRADCAPHYYYIEMRTIPDDIKVYVQVHPVDYADYIVGRAYVSPFSLMTADGTKLIDPMMKR